VAALIVLGKEREKTFSPCKRDCSARGERRKDILIILVGGSVYFSNQYIGCKPVCLEEEACLMKNCPFQRRWGIKGGGKEGTIWIEN